MATVDGTPHDAVRDRFTEVDVIGDRQHLAGLMVEIRNLLQADTAVFLMIDATGRQLEPVVSVGMGRANRAAMRVPVGRGFAGRIAASRSTLVITDVETAEIYNPVLRRRGLQSLLGAPVLVNGTVAGVVHVGSETDRSFTSDDVALLERSAQRLASAIENRRTAEEHTAALILQRSLLPDVLPQIPGLDFAARYLPADGDFGGDWYDVFTLSGGRVGIVMGDVAGHGLASSVIMGRLRSALRAYALDYEDPAQVLSRLDRKLVHFEPGAMATVLYAVTEPPFDRMIISSAGHLAPIVVSPPARSGQRGLDLAIDPPLGISEGWSRRAAVIELSVGDVFCAFTDGLVERRPVADDLFPDIEVNIREVADCLEDETSEANCANVLGRMVSDDADDDVAVLVMRRTPPG